MDFFLIAALFIITFFAFLIQSIMSFGAMAFALPLVLFFVPKMAFIPVAQAFGFITAVFIFKKHRKKIPTKEFIIFLLLACVGTFLGSFISLHVDAHHLIKFLGCFIITNSIIALLKIYGVTKTNNRLKPIHRLYPLASGVVQYIYSMGGVISSTYVAKITHSKSSFRATMAVIVLTLNPFVFATYCLEGKVHFSHVELFCWLLPAVILANVLGFRIASKIKKRTFSIALHVMLILLGSLIFFR